ncbi:archaeal/vacuolar-type H+-ATPase subunit H [Clostridium putrefaciens]|uniref:Archaeal/vacuolar-type H+-ATPase subunit H n=1 Tax=Clostridium putrefaciens TaxID=99675 RepID=A0A381JA19_9CLOT|nr:ATPase [Clostridium putrefaciens]SUY47286.1 archaeal/vacuolar-type H+-ATPase subunit H [Clostridium putrefaciens]
MDVIQLLEYLQEIIDGASKVPITGKIVLDKKEMLEVIDQIINYMPDEFKKAQWVLSEKERILEEAREEYDNIKGQTVDMMKKQVENHDITKEAKMKSQDIIALAQRDAKAIRLGARDYADEVLCQLDEEMKENSRQMIENIKKDVEGFMKILSEDLSQNSSTIRENIKELRNIK